MASEKEVRVLHLQQRITSSRICAGHGSSTDGQRIWIHWIFSRILSHDGWRARCYAFGGTKAADSHCARSAEESPHFDTWRGHIGARRCVHCPFGNPSGALRVFLSHLLWLICLANSERRVQDALDMVSSGRTVLVIAHRLSTIQNADCIIVMGEGGRILESGTHKELMKSRHGHYSELYRQSVNK